MALVAFLRGVNVGGHRTFRPAILAKELSAFDVVNIGAAGTFVVRKPGTQATFRAALARKLPFETHLVLCEGRDLIRLETEHPFGRDASPAEITRFVSITSKTTHPGARIPLLLPPEGDWLVRLIAHEKRFVFGEYRRHMKTIGYLSQIDKILGTTATTRNWNTIMSIVRILKESKRGAT